MSVARKRGFNSISGDLSVPSYFRTKVCPQHIAQVILKVVKASESEVQIKHMEGTSTNHPVQVA